MPDDFESFLSYALSCLKLENVKLKDMQRSLLLTTNARMETALCKPT